VLHVLCPRSLRLIGYEGICGRFGRIGVRSQHIGLLGFRPDDVGVSFTVLAGLFVRTALYMTETDHVMREHHVTDVRRFDVKDRAKALST
jgi:hypothetical protein